MSEPSAPKVRVWDLPTRVFHWALTVAVVASFVSGQVGDGALAWHFRFGTVVLALIAFRVLWGLVGGRWSRFVSFLYAPGTVLRYLRGQARPDEHLDVGHSPTGAASVFALLLLLAVQLGTGLVADDEIATVGPLNRYVASATALSATSWHKTWGQWLLVALVVLHVAAIVYYRVKKRVDLLQPMLSGDKDLPPDTPASADGAPQRWLALALLLACFGVAGWIFQLGG